jgi:hypothetical protein
MLQCKWQLQDTPDVIVQIRVLSPPTMYAMQCSLVLSSTPGLHSGVRRPCLHASGGACILLQRQHDDLAAIWKAEVTIFPHRCAGFAWLVGPMEVEELDVMFKVMRDLLPLCCQF